MKVQSLFEEASHIKSSYDDFNNNYQVGEMLYLQPKIVEMIKDCKEREFIATLDQEVIFDNYE